MTEQMPLFEITEISWERIHLHMKVRAIRENETSEDAIFFLEREDGRRVPLQYRRDDDAYSFSLNIACMEGRSFLENGRWRVRVQTTLAGGQGDKDSISTCGITADMAYRLEDCSRVFRYAENQMAYTVSFGVTSDDEKTLQPYIDSFFMEENRAWKRRRYIKEVRSAGDKAKRVFMYAAIILIRLYYHILYALSPKHGNRVMLMSETHDEMGGNLKYIDARIKARGLDKRFRMTYSFRGAAGKHQSVGDISGWIRLVTKIARQDYIFVDDYAPVFGFFRLGEKTKLIQVWHAGEGFKSVGYSRFGKDGSPFPQGSCHRQYTHVITGSEHLIDVFHEVFAIEKDAFYPMGMARLDGFLDEAHIESLRNSLYKEHDDWRDKRIILFAPTYRGSEQKLACYDYDKIDLERINAYCAERGAVFLIKMHPFVKERVDIPAAYRDSIIDVSDYPNINDLYYITDLLITDYSSNYFEYALLRRPVIFYTYDREIYELTRGVHRSVIESAPGKVCDTFDELMECLYDEDFETEKIERFADENFEGCQGNAADRIIDEILLEEEAK